ncbi:MAG TPA: DUF488 family protein [Candidatus Limnocylindrales bacterium]|nr:DUF488 family protein [Candidatus Limnocylindrales bacterium]
MDIRLSRAYDEPGPDDGQRVLVDRVWPRGRKRETLHLDAWMREVGPSDELRHWFGHEPERWPEFRRRYRAELAAPPRAELVDELAARAQRGRLTLVFGAADRERNQAMVLAELLRERLA